jgi:uncharacterized protein (TIGR03435 family)
MILSVGRNGLFKPRLVAAAAMLTSSWIPAAAQTSMMSEPSYVVSTVRPSNPNSPPDNDDIGFDNRSGEFDTVNQSLWDLIKFAYDLSFNADKQIVGGPRWVGSAKFDIVAKTDGETVAALQKLTRKQEEEQVR